jgi:hypothetical protein
MTYSILLVVVRPNITNHKEQSIWNGGLIELAALAKQNEDIQLLGESTVQLPLNHGLQGISDVVRCLDSRGLKYTYTVLTGDVEWHGEAKVDYNRSWRPPGDLT